jgi:Na+/proline symporter
MGFFEIQIVIIVIAAGFLYFVNTAWKHRKDSYRLKSFFLGGAQLGPTLTEHNSLGMTFAWSGGTWFFVLMAFYYGPWVALLQIPWCLSIVFFGLLFTRIQNVTRNKTIHGFLEICYDRKVRIVACLATSLGYIFNTGFELFWSGKLFSSVFDISLIDLALPVGIVLSIITAVYCNIGGYRANASTDKSQNILGVLALAILSVFVALSTKSSPLILSSIIFSVGSLIYIIISLISKHSITNSFSKIISAFSLIIAIATIIISIWLSLITNTNVENTALFKIDSPSIIFLVGLIFFQLIFNIVDMANWQSIAANGDIPLEEHTKMKWSIIRSALYLNWFPALGGTIIGLGLRTSMDISLINDNNIFHFAFTTVLVGQGEIIRGLLLGIILLGFISTTLSTADSYLMAAANTLTYDLFMNKRVKKLLLNENPDEEKKLIHQIKGILFPLSIFMVIFFWLSYYFYSKIGGNVLDFQMIMYSFAISLFTPVLYGLFKKNSQINLLGTTTFLAITFGILSSVLPYLYTIIFDVSDSLRGILVNLTPLYSFLASTIIFFIGKSLIIKKI